jgi:hypothetical protein
MDYIYSSVYLSMAVAILKYEKIAKFASENSQNSKLGGSRFVSIKTLNIVKKACLDINVQTQKILIEKFVEILSFLNSLS